MSGVTFQTVDENSAGQRLDNFLLKILKGVPRSKVYQIVRKGEVRVNGKRRKVADRLKIGDEVRIPPVRLADKPQSEVAPRWVHSILQDAIISETAEYLVVNKPAGIAVHGGSGLKSGLIEALRLARPDEYFELVHRLDRGTSGVLVVARSRQSLLAAQQALESADKRYVVLVSGEWPDHAKRVQTNIAKALDKSGERRMVNADQGKLSTTRFSVRKRYKHYTLLTARLDSGRTHQIRIHCKHIGCPVVGDDKYAEKAQRKSAAADGFKRMMLHAEHLELRGVGAWDAPMPSALGTLLKELE